MLTCFHDDRVERGHSDAACTQQDNAQAEMLPWAVYWETERSILSMRASRPISNSCAVVS